MGNMVPTIDGVPVLLPSHDHPEFGDSGRHYHVDFRYCSNEPKQDQVIFSENEPIYKELNIVRECYQIQLTSPDLLVWLSRQYKRTICGACPHRGLPIMPIGDDTYQCVGHGMVFNSEKDVIKKFRIRVGGNYTRLRLHKKEYRFVMSEEGKVNEAILETLRGVKVGSIPLGGWHSFNKGDFVVLKIS